MKYAEMFRFGAEALERAGELLDSRPSFGDGNSAVAGDLTDFIHERYPGAVVVERDWDDGFLEIEIRHEGREKDLYFNGRDEWLASTWEARLRDLPDGSLQMWHIYLVNAVLGLMNAFQSPAQSIAVGMLVPKEKLGQASGMDSFSSNLVTVIAPVLASALFAFGGLESVIALDLVSFLANFVVLLLFIRLPEAPKGAKAYGTKTGGAGKGAAHGGFAGMLEGFRFLRGHKVVTLRIGLDRFQILSGILSQDLV